MNAAAPDLAPHRSHSGHERLLTTLVFALLAHGIVVLGIGFTALVPEPVAGRAVSVALVNTETPETPRHARYLARVNQRGPGNTRVQAPYRRVAVGPFPHPGYELAGNLADAVANETTAGILIGPSAQRQATARSFVTTPAESDLPAPAVEESGARTRAPLIARLHSPGQRDDTGVAPVELPRLYGLHPEGDADTVNARAAVYTPYLRAWQRRIERVGTEQFARLVPAGIEHGELMLAVTLGADGSVRSVSIEKRARYPALDAAALEIIRLAAPFPPFPPDVRTRMSSLTFTYRWRFIRGGDNGGTVGIGPNN